MFPQIRSQQQTFPDEEGEKHVSLHVRFSPNRIDHSRQEAEGLILDFDHNGKLIGFEMYEPMRLSALVEFGHRKGLGRLKEMPRAFSEEIGEDIRDFCLTS